MAFLQGTLRQTVPEAALGDARWLFECDDAPVESWNYTIAFQSEQMFVSFHPNGVEPQESAMGRRTGDQNAALSWVHDGPVFYSFVRKAAETMIQPSVTPIRVAVIGAGWFASRRHIPDLLQDQSVELVAACRRDTSALETICNHFNIPGRYTDFEQMLRNEQPDAAVIASPHAHHSEQIRRCLELGVHVLVEKPLALTVMDAERLSALALQQSRVLAVALNPPYWPFCHTVRDWIDEGRIGSLEAVQIAWLNCAAGFFGREALPEKLPGVVRPTLFRSDPKLSGGGQLMDGGQHNISELLWVTRQPAVSVAATMDQLPVDLRSCVSVTLANGAVGSVLGIADSHYGERRAHSTYFGSDGTIRVNVAPFKVTLERKGQENVVVQEPDMPKVPSPVADLIECIRTGRQPLGAPSHAVDTTRVIEMAYRSAAEAMHH